MVLAHCVFWWSYHILFSDGPNTFCFLIVLSHSVFRWSYHMLSSDSPITFCFLMVPSHSVFWCLLSSPSRNNNTNSDNHSDNKRPPNDDKPHNNDDDDDEVNNTAALLTLKKGGDVTYYEMTSCNSHVTMGIISRSLHAAGYSPLPTATLQNIHPYSLPSCRILAITHCHCAGN